ncbi:MAG: hypothetical protein EPO08_13415 [Rhodospirillaceae bacterium]|nr:MAG: hypothetical protein EPO08_13415 [Rhodospirillaceae bacterium]
MDDREIFARALPPPIDVAVDGHFAGKLTPQLRYELQGWVLLSLAALGLAGVLALMLSLARAPGAEILPFLDQVFFRRVLVVHVTFAFVAWYLGIQGAMTVLVTARLESDSGRTSFGATLVGRAGLYGAILSYVLLLIPVVGDRGVPSPNNYIPVLLNPFYFAGLAGLALSVALPVLRFLARVVRLRHVEASTLGIACAGVIYLLALACVPAAWVTRPQGFDAEGVSEYMMWGVGHVLQFANTTMLLCVAYLLSRITLGETPLPPRLFKAMMLLLVAGAAAGPLFYLGFDGGDPTQRFMFTALYRFILPLPAAVVCVSVVALLVRRRRDLWEGAPEARGLAAAMVLFGYGGLIGFFESSVDTRTPAHYHAELIAVTLVFMTAYFALFLPLLGRRTERRRLRTAMYLTLGGGQFLHSTGLFIAGAMGVARKTAGAAQGLDSSGKVFALALQGVGGVIAVTGGIIFIVLAGKLLLAKREPSVTATGLGGVEAV